MSALHNQIFNELDINADGVLDRKELEMMHFAFDQCFCPEPAQTAQQILNAVDGKVDAGDGTSTAIGIGDTAPPACGRGGAFCSAAPAPALAPALAPAGEASMFARTLVGLIRGAPIFATFVGWMERSAPEVRTQCSPASWSCSWQSARAGHRRRAARTRSACWRLRKRNPPRTTAPDSSPSLPG